MPDSATAVMMARGQPRELAGNTAPGKAQWVHLLPAGIFTGSDGRGPFDASSPQEIIATTVRRSGNKPVPVDYDHQTDLGAKKGLSTAPAAGWIVDWQARENGIWGLVEWTPRGALLLKDKEYRFLSPVFAHSPKNKVLALLRAGLTNDPNLELTALNNKAGMTMPDTSTPSFMQKLRELLELPDASSEDEIVSKLQNLLTARNSVDPSKFVSIELFSNAVRRIQELDTGASREAAEMLVDRALHEKKMFPGMRDWAIQLCMANRPAFDSFLHSTGNKMVSFIEDLTSSHYRRPSDRDRQQTMGAEERDVMTTLGLNEDDCKTYGAKSQ